MARYIGNCYLVFALRKQTYAFIVKLVTAFYIQKDERSPRVWPRLCLESLIKWPNENYLDYIKFVQVITYIQDAGFKFACTEC